MSPAAFAQARAVGAASIFFALLVCSRRQRFPLHLKVSDWLALAGLAASGITFNHFLYCVGIARTSVVHTGLIVALGPAIVLVISCLLRIEHLTTLRAIGIAVSCGGAAFLTISKAGPGRGAEFFGDMMVLASIVFGAVYAILLKRSANRFDVFTLNVGIFGIGALFLLPIGVRASLRVRWVALPALAWAGLLFVILMGSVLGFVIQAWVMAALDPSQVQVFTYLQPLISTAAGVLWLGENLPAGGLLGGIMIIFGVFLAAR
jgi:drug/metabolite transporter (DMT)-like permease